VSQRPMVRIKWLSGSQRLQERAPGESKTQEISEEKQLTKRRQPWSKRRESQGSQGLPNQGKPPHGKIKEKGGTVRIRTLTITNYKQRASKSHRNKYARREKEMSSKGAGPVTLEGSGFVEETEIAFKLGPRPG